MKLPWEWMVFQTVSLYARCLVDTLVAGMNIPSEGCRPVAVKLMRQEIDTLTRNVDLLAKSFAAAGLPSVAILEVTTVPTDRFLYADVGSRQ